jgi:hypothetical protein
MRLPPLLSTLPFSAQIQIAVLGPLLLGAISGFLLDTTAAGYWVVQVAGTGASVSSGMEHSGLSAGARRGLVAGGLFAAGLVGAYLVSNRPALAYIPHPVVLTVPGIALIGAVLGGMGGVARRRYEMRYATEPSL